MENSIILARIIGPYLSIISLGLLFNVKTVQKIIKGFEDNEALIYIGGVLALMIGLILVNIHNTWEASWTVIITFIGWIALVKGTCLMFCPRHFLKAGEMFHKGTAALIIHIAVVLVLGIVLTLGGFFLA